MRAIRRNLLVVLIGVLVLIAAGAAYRERDGLARLNPWRSRPAESSSSMAGAAGSVPAPDDQARGAVDLDPRRRQLIGVHTAVVTRQTRTPHVRAVGTIKVDETRVVDVNVKVEGWVRELRVNVTGEAVTAGQPLFVLYSPDVLATEEEYLLAASGRTRARQSTVPGAAERMDGLAQAARRRLALWDIPADLIAALDSTGATQATILFSSPATGVVLDKPAVLGLHVMPGQTLYRIGDLSSVWMDADVREADLPQVRIGAPVVVSLDAMGGAPIQGRTIYLSPTLADDTRTAKLRVELPNANGRLKPGMFATMDFDGAAYSALIVPTDAVLDSGTEQIVFVAEDEGHFTPRRVQVRARLDDVVAIASGLREGERVATGAAFFLDSESQVRGAASAYDPQPAGGTPAPAAGAPRARLDIALHTTPDPLRAGDNDLEVVVTDAQGAPVSDADVSVFFYMAAMPSMNMPAMRQNVKLGPAGGGRYRGLADVQMAGRWDVTVTVARGGRVVGTSALSLTAR